jgi:hypothetical protein
MENAEEKPRKRQKQAPAGVASIIKQRYDGSCGGVPVCRIQEQGTRGVWGLSSGRVI